MPRSGITAVRLLARPGRDLGTNVGVDSPAEVGLSTAKAAGATQVEARASREPRFKIYADTVDRSMGLYGRVIGSMLDEIDAVLEGAVPSATKRGFELAREAGAGPASGEPDG